MELNIRKGLNLPIQGAPDVEVMKEKNPSTIALLGCDYIDMKPSMLVKEGDVVEAGQALFSCKKNVGLVFTAPLAGTVKAIHRGDKRVFQSLVLEVSNTQSQVAFTNFIQKEPSSYTTQEVRSLLIESGHWAGIRQRPFDKVADVEGNPSSIFITAVDTHPLSMDPCPVVCERSKEFETGIEVLSSLTEGFTYVCVAHDSRIHTPLLPNIKRVSIQGPHPAGNVGTHMHFVDPVHPLKYAWHVGYQEVIAIGHLFLTGKLYTRRVLSLAGPFADKPCLVSTTVGANISEITKGHVQNGARVISGSVLHGHQASGSFDYLGRFSNQISIVKEDTTRELLGWHSPGLNKFSIKNVFASKLMKNKLFNMGTSTHGSPRAMVPVGAYEAVMPMDILPTQLLRALVSKDTDTAQDLGCLELAEEDLGLLTFVSPGKEDFGPLLRENLRTIEKEG